MKQTTARETAQPAIDAAADDSGVRVDELSAMIRARLEHQQLKLREAASESGVSPATLSRVLNGKLPDTKTFAALVRWLGVSADLFIPNPASASAGAPLAIEAHLRADRTLPPEVARALADLVRATYSSHIAAAGQAGHAQEKQAQ